MNQQINTMKYFIETAGRRIVEESHEEPELNQVEMPPEEDKSSEILDKLRDALFKFDSFYREGSDDYMRGLQDGLNYAMDVIDRIIEQSEEDDV